jgi:hypothetical protein
MKWSAHKDIAIETTAQLNSKIPATLVKFDTILPTLHNWSVKWLVNAYHDINDKNLILKVYKFAYSKVGKIFNLILHTHKHGKCAILVNLTSCTLV